MFWRIRSVVMLGGILVIVIGIFIIDYINNEHHSNSQWFLVAVASLILFGTPLLTQYYGLVKGVSGNKADWLGFWGSYLGIIPSGLVTWAVAKKQIDSSRENDRKNYLEGLYLDDLREIKKILLLNGFSGKWNFPYNTDIDFERLWTSNEIDMFRKTFLKITNDGDSETIRTNELFDIKTIVHGLPITKRDKIEKCVDQMCDEILRLASYTPDEFREMEIKYFETAKHKNSGDVEMANFKLAKEEWEVKSGNFFEHIKTITANYNKLDAFVNDELSIYYKL